MDKFILSEKMKHVDADTLWTEAATDTARSMATVISLRPLW